MKAIFLFFLALNMAFFVWQFSTSGNSNAAAQLGPLPSNVKKLVLLDEGKAAARVKAAKKKSQEAKNSKSAKKKAAAKSSPAGGAEICYSLGPFETSKQAKPIAAKLRDLGAITKIEDQKRRRRTVAL